MDVSIKIQQKLNFVVLIGSLQFWKSWLFQTCYNVKFDEISFLGIVFIEMHLKRFFFDVTVFANKMMISHLESISYNDCKKYHKVRIFYMCIVCCKYRMRTEHCCNFGFLNSLFRVERESVLEILEVHIFAVHWNTANHFRFDATFIVASLNLEETIVTPVRVPWVTT